MGGPILSAGLCSHRVVQMVWLRPSFLSCEVGRWWGKFVSRLNDSSPRSLGLSCYTILRRSQHVSYTIAFFLFLFFLFEIISPPPLAPWALEGYRGADVAPLLALNCKASWTVKSRERWDGSGWLQQQYNRHFSAFDMLEKGQFSRFVEDNLTETHWRLVSPHSPLDKLVVPVLRVGWKLSVCA